ncbi:MAG TPA: L-histidine N(alpha)-methyltransferase [Bryobacteraceae bacterium]|jgi:L-histidine N-alpha-methyltransferase|nr:L-histidine N(alpha)-methyltransferase [Bryobacteraceae bacterium]
MILTTAVQTRFAEEVCAGLQKPGQKELPSKYLYDAVGSRLFDVITELPEYGLTRAEDRILERHARDIALRVPHAVAIAELGSGSGMKTRRVLGALSRDHHARYFPIEISHTALAACEREMRDIGSLSVVGIEREYLDGLLEVAARRREGEHLLVLFLGSTIGNFEPPAALVFLRKIRSMLEPGDFLLLGTDLLKPVSILLDAYDDPLGVTAAFNLNLLARINRELGGHFLLAQFEHEARFNEKARSIEMHLRAKQAQAVSIDAADITIAFREGETIWTESSHKYRRPEIPVMAADSGFACSAQWIDEEWGFAENLWVAE